MQLAQAARLEFEQHAGHRRRDGKAAGVDAPFAATLVHGVGRLGEHAKLVRIGRRMEAVQIGRLLCGWNRTLGEINFTRWEPIERGLRQAEVLGQERLRRVAEPVADAERAKFGEVAVVEDQDEVRRLVAQAAEDVTVTAREIPNVARLEVVGLGVAVRIDGRRADAPRDDERPFGRRGVPMEFAHDAGFERHRHAGDALGNRKLRDGRLFADAAADHFAR